MKGVENCENADGWRKMGQSKGKRRYSLIMYHLRRIDDSIYYYEWRRSLLYGMGPGTARSISWMDNWPV